MEFDGIQMNEIQERAYLKPDHAEPNTPHLSPLGAAVWPHSHLDLWAATRCPLQAHYPKRLSTNSSSNPSKVGQLNRLSQCWSAGRDRAYAPYSKFQLVTPSLLWQVCTSIGLITSVGASLLFDNDVIVTGCNVENASYGMSPIQVLSIRRRLIEIRCGSMCRTNSNDQSYRQSTSLLSSCNGWQTDWRLEQTPRGSRHFPPTHTKRITMWNLSTIPTWIRTTQHTDIYGSRWLSTRIGGSKSVGGRRGLRWFDQDDDSWGIVADEFWSRTSRQVIVIGTFSQVIGTCCHMMV